MHTFIHTYDTYIHNEYGYTHTHIFDTYIHMHVNLTCYLSLCSHDRFNRLHRLHRREVRSRDSFNRLHRLHRRQVLGGHGCHFERALLGLRCGKVLGGWSFCLQ